MKKGDVVVIRLGTGTGHEQIGDRPAILVSDTGTSIVVVIPLTGNVSALRFPYTLTILPNKSNGLSYKSVALVFHVRAVDKSRVERIVGRVSVGMHSKINKMLKQMLDL